MHVVPPWTSPLTGSEHDLILFGLVTTALALIATLVRVRFASAESQGAYRTASLTANAVVAIAALSYVVLVAVFLLGYREEGGLWQPTGLAELAWSVRYMDWCVTVPLLVVELMSVGALPAARAAVLRTVGIALAVAMVVTGYLGGVVVDGGRDPGVVTLFGVAGAVCFAGLYAIVLHVLVASTPLLPAPSRAPLSAAVLLLLVVWFVYPVVYGIQGATSGGAWAAVGQLLLCSADLVAKIGFGSLIHRTAVLRSRADEQADPETPRPRASRAEPVWVGGDHAVSFDFPRTEDTAAPSAIPAEEETYR